MKFCEAFNATLEEFRISGKSLAAEAGVREATISEFRRGIREIHTDNLERMIEALPPQAQQHFFLHCLVTELNDEAIATLLHMISMRLRADAKAEKEQRMKIPA